MIILDTNVVAEAMRRRPDTRVIAWLDRLDPSEGHLAAMTVAELRSGVAVLPEGRRRDELHRRVERLIVEDFA